MIRVVFDPSSLTDEPSKQWWLAWRAHADAATDNAIDAFETWLDQRPTGPFKFEFDDTIWKELKDWIREKLFYGKCAYCESRILRNPTHAEHYRPKGGVKRKNAAGKLEVPFCEIADPIDKTVLRIVHTGYFWLAYDWRNLVPSCFDCNAGQGKKERFDIQNEYRVLVALSRQELDALPEYAKPRPSKKWPGYYYLSPAELDKSEVPLLLNPLNCDESRLPRKHICFGVRGSITAVDNSRIGAMTIETFGLKAEQLRIARQEAQERCVSDYYDKMRKVDRTEAKSLLADYRNGRFPYSAASLDYLQICRQEEEMVFQAEA